MMDTDYKQLEYGIALYYVDDRFHWSEVRDGERGVSGHGFRGISNEYVANILEKRQRLAKLNNVNPEDVPIITSDKIDTGSSPSKCLSDKQMSRVMKALGGK
jgi:hypothetical protein